MLEALLNARQSVRLFIVVLMSSLLMTFIVTGPSPAAAATASISGTILDQNGLPARWVEVRVGHPGQEYLAKANTDANGYYAFNGLAPGTYTLAAGSPEFEYLWRENATEFDGGAQQFELGSGASVTRNAVTQRPTWLVVSVKDSVGEPVTTNVGVWAEVAGQPTAYCNRAIKHTTDPSSLLLVCDQGGSITVFAQRGSTETSTVVHAELGAITPVSLTVPATRKASGRVLNASRKPVAGVRFEPRNPGSGAVDPPCGWGGPTGTSGKFSVTCAANSTVTYDVTTRSLSYLDRTLTVSVGTVNKNLGDIRLSTAAKAQGKVVKNTGKKLTNGPCLVAYRKSGASWVFNRGKGSGDPRASTTDVIGGLRSGTYKFMATECYPDGHWGSGWPPTPSHERKWVGGGKAYKLKAGRTVKLPTTKLRPAYNTTLSISEITPPPAPGGTVDIAVMVKPSGTTAGPTGTLNFEVEHANGDDVAIFSRSLLASSKGRLTVTVPEEVMTGSYKVRVSFRGTGVFRDVRSPVDSTFVVP